MTKKYTNSEDNFKRLLVNNGSKASREYQRLNQMLLKDNSQ